MNAPFTLYPKAGKVNAPNVIRIMLAKTGKERISDENFPKQSKAKCKYTDFLGR
jgi:hypothetical protein